MTTAQVPGYVSMPQRNWILQILDNLMALRRGDTVGINGKLVVVQGLVLLVSLGMLGLAIVTSVDAWMSHVLLISPPLIANFFGGIAGIILAQATGELEI